MDKKTRLTGCGYPYSHSGCLPMGPYTYNTVTIYAQCTHVY